MNIKILGCGGYQPSESRHTACFYLPSAGIVLDAGTGMFRLPRQLASDSIDVLLSHAHLDHVIGLTFLLNAMASGKLNRFVVYAESAKIETIQEHLFANLLFPVVPSIEFRPLEDNFSIGEECAVSWFSLKHPGGSVGFRLDWPDRSMAYVTDTTAEEDAPYIDAIQDVDLLIHECYFTDTQQADAELTGHSCVTAVTQVAAAARAKRLLLVHVNPEQDDSEELMEAAELGFPGAVLGQDGMTIQF